MLTCNDCIHYDVCKGKHLIIMNEELSKIFCNYFSNKNNYKKITFAYWLPVKEEGFWLDDIKTWSVTNKPTEKTMYKCSNCGKKFGSMVISNNFICCPCCGSYIVERKNYE